MHLPTYLPRLGGMDMDKVLTLLQDTDRLLAEADENLKALEALEIVDESVKLQDILNKHFAFSALLVQKKTVLLEALIKLARVIGKESSACYRIPSSCSNARSLSSAGGIPAISYEEFCRSEEYQAFCQEIIQEVGQLLQKKTPETEIGKTSATQKAEGRAFVKLVNDLKRIFEGQPKASRTSRRRSSK